MRIIKSTLNLVFIGFLVYVSSCSRPGDTPEYKEETGHPPSLNTEREELYATSSQTATEFATEAASDGMMEVQMAKIALDHAQNSQVKELAEMIRQDHQRANDKLTEIGREQNITLPNNLLEKHKQKIQKLKSVNPNNFDAQYVKMMIETHQKAVDKFQRMAEKPAEPDSSNNIDNAETQAGNNGFNPQLLNWINETLPVLQKHLERSKELQDQLSKLNAS